MSFWRQASGILGMNARNLQYISRYNSPESKRFADNKLYTKQFLESRGVGVAKLYHVVSKYQQLTPEFWDALPESFVLKPNKGFGGGGILVITEGTPTGWVTASGRKVSRDQMFRHCIEILEGKYSISGVGDRVIIEERLEMHRELATLCEVGLPDIRVIVFNRVPVLAMVRVPTYESEGKANMELGAVALGVDIATGQTTGGAYYKKYIRKMPNGVSAVGFTVPHWQEVLLTASRVQTLSDIGYLGVDMVLTPQGVKVLELNARAGLKIQIANKVPLKARLNKVEDLTIHSAEEGVQIAQQLFRQRAGGEAESTLDRPVVGPEEYIELYNEGKTLTLLAQMSLEPGGHQINVEGYSKPIADIALGGERLKLPVEIAELPPGVGMRLSLRELGQFYLDPRKPLAAPTLMREQTQSKRLTSLDEKLEEIAKEIKVLSHINPQNIEEQRELFLGGGGFDPQWVYRERSLDIDGLRRDLKKLPLEFDHPLVPLYARKVREIEHTLTMIEMVGTEGFAAAAEAVYGTVTGNVHRRASERLASSRPLVADDSEEWSLKQAMKATEAYLRQYKLGHWQLKVIDNTVADMQVTKRNVILFKAGATFRRNRLRALMAHEVATHVFRYENGRRQPYALLRRGTAGYLQTEEGLAVYNQNQLGLALGWKYLSPALHVVAIYLGRDMGFRDLYLTLRETYELPPELAWKHCLKAKRGLRDTSRGGVFTKDSLYFRGLLDIERFVARGGNLAELYVGKIAVSDLPLLRGRGEILSGKFIPEYLTVGEKSA